MAKRTIKRNGNREYKSDVFSMLMQNKSYALEVYNALNDSDYDDPKLIEIITSEHGISLSIRNDASFIIDKHINYYEHQSTYNPNMPLRCLIYYVNDIEKHIDLGKNDLYGNRVIHLPTPHFVVFYNGKKKCSEVEKMKLSDSFIHKTDYPELEVLCTSYNINSGCNVELKDKSKILYGYSVFVEKVERYRKEYNSLKLATEISIEECIKEGILVDFFEARRKEVVKMVTLDYTVENRIKIMKKNIKQERINTERERKRAEAAEKEVERLRKQLEK